MDKIKHHIYNNNLTYSKAFLILGYVLCMSSCLFIGENRLWKDSYYHLNESGVAFYLLSYYLLSIKQTKKHTLVWQTIALVALLSSISTLVDELFYDSTLVEVNDLIRFISIIVFSISYKYKLAPKTKWLKR